MPYRLAAAAIVAALTVCGIAGASAWAQSRMSSRSASVPTPLAYGTVDERDIRIVVERVAAPRAIEYRVNLLPKGGLRVDGTLGVTLAAVSAEGWRFDPPLPHTYYAGNDYVADAPEIVMTAASVRGVPEAVIRLTYALCRDTACFSRDTTLAITQR